MALSILDGNQSATTLSTILSSGQHITAHTVVSLGTQAITDMRGAVSGSVVSISNLPSTQTIAGTVTANGLAVGSTVANVFPIGVDTQFSGVRTVTDLIGYRLPISLGDSSAVVSASLSDPLPAGTNRIGVVTIGAGTVTLGASTSQIGSVTASISNSLTISSLPAISGTVTANVFGKDANNPTVNAQIPVIAYDEEITGAGVSYVVPVQISNNDGTIGSNNPLPISGTVTIGSALPAGTNRIGVVTIGAGTVTIGAGTAQIGSVTASISNSVTIASLPAISGTVTANGGNFSSLNTSQPENKIQVGFQTTGGDFVAVNEDGQPFPVNVFIDGTKVESSNPLPISGTVTANSSNGSLTTRFGSVTTANTSFATSAVTNANRKYLLIQNITTASNVVTVGIGFTPTTTQGIQLFAGAGLTFEGSYIPTGAVNLLSSVTASCYTILEA